MGSHLPGTSLHQSVQHVKLGDDACSTVRMQLSFKDLCCSVTTAKSMSVKQHSTQRGTAQHSTAQHSTAQHETLVKSIVRKAAALLQA